MISFLSTLQKDRGPAILDEMKLELKDMKIAKVQLSGLDELDTTSPSALSSDESRMIGAHCDKNILNPTSFALIIKRNLSAGWYKELPELDVSGAFKSIVVS